MEKIMIELLSQGQSGIMRGEQAHLLEMLMDVFVDEGM